MGDQIPSLGISAIPNNGLANNEFSFPQSTLMNQHPNPAKDKAFWFVWAFGRAPQEANDMVVECNDSLFTKDLHNRALRALRWGTAKHRTPLFANHRTPFY